MADVVTARSWLLVPVICLALGIAVCPRTAALASMPPPQAVATATPTAAPLIPATHLSFFLYAARVTTPKAGGDLSGLASVRPGMTVWLMMYYVIKSVPAPMLRIAAYSVLHGRQTIYRQSFRGKVATTEIGHFSRYLPYSVPNSLPHGQYVFRATLWIGGKKEVKSWFFDVGDEVQVAATGYATSAMADLNYFLYAARVAPAGDAGALDGLASVRPGMTVWLMMYYVIKTVPGTMLRISTYSLLHGNQTIYRHSFQGKVATTEVGHFSRYLPYTLPARMRRGRYVFRAALWIGGKRQIKTWSFVVGNGVRVVHSHAAGSAGGNVAARATEGSTPLHTVEQE